jgi:hypothetical protein
LVSRDQRSRQGDGRANGYQFVTIIVQGRGIRSDSVLIVIGRFDQLGTAGRVIVVHIEVENC